MDKSINRNTCNPITDTKIEKFEVEIMPYEDEILQEMKPEDPDSEMLHQNDAPTPEDGNKYTGMGVLVTRVEG